MDSSNHPCDPLSKLLSNLNDEVARAEQALQEAEDSGRKPDPIRLQIKTLQQQIGATYRALQNCLANQAPDQPPPMLAPTPPKSFSNLEIVGIEVTQATQFFRLRQDLLPIVENFVPLVANKPTVIRVYVNLSASPSYSIPSQVTGKLSYNTNPGSQLISWSPINGPIATMPSSAIDRGNANHTLNFRVPAADCLGLKTFTVEVFDPAKPFITAYSSQLETFKVGFELSNWPNIHGVLIRYTGGNTNISEPSNIDLIDALALVARAYPISGLNFASFDVIEFDGDLTLPPGNSCGPGWDKLVNILLNMRSASNTKNVRDVYVGLIPRAVPTSFVGGCSIIGKGVAVGYVGDPVTFLQEIGHAFGRMHAPCGNPPNPDPNYPIYYEDFTLDPALSKYKFYPSYPSASIGTYGFDIVTSQVFDPKVFSDFMSYCHVWWSRVSQWVSPYTYLGLKDAILSSTVATNFPRPGIADVVRDYLYLNFRMYRDGKVELLPSFHLLGHQPSKGSSPPAPVSFDLLGDDGRVIGFHRCHFANACQDPDGPYVDFHEVTEWEPGIGSIAFVRDGHVVHTLEVEKSPPEVTIRDPRPLDDKRELLRIDWDITPGEIRGESERTVTYMLRYSNDRGKSWRAIAANLTDLHYVVDSNRLPGGESCMFQVVASAGIRTAFAETGSLPIPCKPRQALILSPKSHDAFVQDESVVLRGVGFSPDFGSAEFSDLVWTSNLDCCIGVGPEVVTHALSIGRHTIKLCIPDGCEGEASALVFIEIQPKESSSDGVARSRSSLVSGSPGTNFPIS